jgi:asparagine synthase (glutamine-hydrolysing)
MAQVMAHRGPDADGFHFDAFAALAHRRLAIIDLSERGRQPLFSENGRFAIVFNGEIYNYLELRQTLQQTGHCFRTDTDTEVLLVLYEKEGRECLARLNGMFTFAIWDKDTQELFVARDRIGIKPLYYVETAEGLVFASEAKALFEYPGVSTAVDEREVDTFMTFGYVPGERTLFRGIRKLLPGHSLRVTRQGIATSEYWDVQYLPDWSRSSEDTAEELHALLLDAMRIHLRSDVPVGVFLSGGLDSSAVVSLLSESGISGIKTFSIAYRDGGEAFDETPYARRVSDHFGTEHHVLYAEPAQFQDFIPDYVWHMDEPVTEAAALSLYFVSKELRRFVTVALSGEGSDELFAGYQIYNYMRGIELYRRLPASIRKAIVEPMLALLPGQKLRKYARLSQLPLEQRYLGVSLHDPAEKSAIYSAEFSRRAARPDSPLTPFYARTKDLDPLTRMLYSDLKTWLVDDLLIKADKMTMANSVELRVPFLDHRVVEFAATIPSHMKSHGGEVKWILKKAVGKQLPQEIVRRAKVGFPTPLAIMFRSDLSSYLKDLLLSRRHLERGYFERNQVERLIAEHTSEVRDNHKILWQLVVLEEWHRRFVDSHSVSMGR